MRKMNLTLLKSWVSKNVNGKAVLAVKSEMNPSKIGRILRGEKMPDGPEQIALCLATGLSRDELFPVCEATKESA